MTLEGATPVLVFPTPTELSLTRCAGLQLAALPFWRVDARVYPLDLSVSNRKSSMLFPIARIAPMSLRSGIG